MIIRKKVKWHSHYGHHTRDMIQEAHQKNKNVLGTRGLIMSRPAHLSLLPSEWHFDSSGYQASTMASILTLYNTFLSIHKGLWFQGWNKQLCQGYEHLWATELCWWYWSHISYTPIVIIKPSSYIFIVISNEIMSYNPFKPLIHENNLQTNHDG